MAVEMASVMAIKLVRRSSAHHTQVSPPSQVWEGSPGGGRRGRRGKGRGRERLIAVAGGVS